MLISSKEGEDQAGTLDPHRATGVSPPYSKKNPGLVAAERGKSKTGRKKS